MQKAVFEIMCSMDMKNVEAQIVLQCAPVIAGVKISNLLIIKTDGLYAALDILKNSSLFYFLLRKDEEKTTIFLYHPQKLAEYLGREDVTAFLRRMGYEEMLPGQILNRFRARYGEYCETRQSFPHEMGLLLGYPVEDVAGFMEHEGRDFLYTGYWKVYANLSEKICLFREYEQAKEQQLLMMADGIGLKEILRGYHI